MLLKEIQSVVLGHGGPETNTMYIQMAVLLTNDPQFTNTYLWLVEGRDTILECHKNYELHRKIPKKKDVHSMNIILKCG